MSDGYDEHSSGCGCHLCEGSREFAGVETLRSKEAREADERAQKSTCICTDPYAGFHSYACIYQGEITPPKVYVASRASNPVRSQMWRFWRDSGVRITSSWIDAVLEPGTPDMTHLWARFGVEIERCDRLVLYVEPEDFPLKGALVEIGMALALKKPVFIVAPGVDIDPIEGKPLGSWVRHPLVRVVSSLEKAFSG